MKRLFFAVLLASCATTPTPVPSADYAAACSNLARIGCQDGVPASCPAILEQMVTARMTNVSVSCLISAGNVEVARGCGGVACP